MKNKERLARWSLKEIAAVRDATERAIAFGLLASHDTRASKLATFIGRSGRLNGFERPPAH